MSTPADHVLEQFSGASGALAGSNAQAASASAQIPQLESDIAGLTNKQADIGTQEAQEVQGTEQQLQQQQAPQRNTKIMDLAPLFIGLTAIGGRAAGIHAKTMLAATNGMVQGLLQGSEQQFNDAQAQFESARKKILETHQLRKQYFDTLYQAYGDQANAKERAIKASRDLVNDGFKHDVDVIKAEQQSDKIMNDLQTKMQGLYLKSLQIQVSQMKEAAQEKHWGNQDTNAANKTAQAGEKQAKGVEDAVSQIDDLQGLIANNPGSTGVKGMLHRGEEFVKTTTGIGDQSTPATDLKTRVHALQLQLPKLITGTSKSAKDERAQVDDIINVTNWGNNDKIAYDKLEQIKQILQKHRYDGSQDAGAQEKATSIKEQFKAGKLTQEQAVSQLQQLGFQP